MGPLLLLVFVGLPFSEIAMFAWVGGKVGVAGTLGLVILGAVLGGFLLRVQGRATVRRAQESLARGELPSREMADGLVLLVAGVLLVIPGFLSDLVALLLLLPGVRGLVRTFLVRSLQRRSRDGRGVQVVTFGSFGRPPPGPPGARARDTEVLDDGRDRSEGRGGE